jgi:hypothetical protein
MSASIEKIEELQKRARIGYEEAKKLLEKHRGDVVESLIELERNKKTKSQFGGSRYDHEEKISKLKQLFHKGNKTKLIITKNGETIVNLPFNYVILSIILGLHLMIISLILVLITGCKIGIQKSEGDIVHVDEAIVDIVNKEKVNLKKNETSQKDEKEYNEHTVE